MSFAVSTVRLSLTGTSGTYKWTFDMEKNHDRHMSKRLPVFQLSHVFHQRLRNEMQVWSFWSLECWKQIYSMTCRQTERDKNTTWTWTDGYCHTLQCRPERCTVKLLQEYIDEDQLPVWKPLQEETTLLPCKCDWLTQCQSHTCCIQEQ